MRLNPFKQEDFLYFYSLQAGVVICSSIGIFLSITTFLVNVISENPEVESKILAGQYSIVFIYCAVSFLAFLLGLISAYQEKFSVIYISLGLQILAFLFWFSLTILAFLNIPDLTRHVCIDNKCPENLWLQDAGWRERASICDQEDLKLPRYYKNSKSIWNYAGKDAKSIRLSDEHFDLTKRAVEKLFDTQEGNAGLLCISILFAFFLTWHYVIIVIYGLFAFMGFFIGLLSAYKESRPLAMTAAVLQSIMFLYWLVFLGISFTNKPNLIRKICIDMRCPDHLWIQDSRWRTYTNTCDPADLKLPLLSFSKKGESSSQTIQLTQLKVKNDSLEDENLDASVVNLQGAQYDVPDVEEKLWVPHGSSVGKKLYMGASITLSIFIGFYLIYSITTLISYWYELRDLEELEGYY